MNTTNTTNYGKCEMIPAPPAGFVHVCNCDRLIRGESGYAGCAVHGVTSRRQLVEGIEAYAKALKATKAVRS